MLNDGQINKIQNKINYKFKNQKLLQQAFTRKSHSYTCNNEVLEFFGDRILDFAVIKNFYELFCRINNKQEFSTSKSVGELSNNDISLTKNSNLAEQITRLGFTKYLQVYNPKERAVLKNKADLFEAILGAVAVDSNWDIKAIEKVYKSMMINNSVSITEENTVDYIDSFNDLLWRYQICKTENQYIKHNSQVECHSVLLIDGKSCELTGYGTDEHSAKNNLSEQGYNLLKLLYERDFIEEISFTYQLYMLYKYGFVGEPDFRFEYYPENSTYPEDLWRCYGSLPESELEFQAEDSTMIGAKERVCYSILCDFFGYENDLVEDEKAEANPTVIRGQGLLKLAMSIINAA